MKAKPKAPSIAALALAEAIASEGIPLDEAFLAARRAILAVAALRASKDVRATGIPAVARRAVRALEAGVITRSLLLESAASIVRAAGASEVSVAFSPDVLTEASLVRARPALARFFARPSLAEDPVDAWQLTYEDLLAFGPARDEKGRTVFAPSSARRALGAHFTPRPVSDRLIVEALRPFSAPSHARLAILDPAMGAGAFLVSAARHLGDGSPRSRRRAVAEQLHGADKDALTVDVARVSLWLSAEGHAAAPAARLVHADALVGADEIALTCEAADRRLRTKHPRLCGRDMPPALHRGRFADVAAAGFDVVIGNPPWVSYAGRAAQPLAPTLRAYFERFGEAFGGYRSLQALFVRRFLGWLAPGGRLAFVLPTSMSDLAGYAPFRRAHDRLAAADAPLLDFGDGGFDGVFQPCMGLVSTRLARERDAPIGAPFVLHRRDADPEIDAFVAHVDALPKVPKTLFAERGFQTTPRERALLAPAPRAGAADEVAMRNGADIAAFVRSRPTAYASRAALGARFRPAEAWTEVRVLVRQTARFPIAALSDGLAFRNSLLAGFEDEDHPRELLVAYLNSSPIRLFHHARVRDARQGMPQMKIAHLRALPALPGGAGAREALLRRGAVLSQRNDGVSAAEQDEIDDLVAAALGLDDRMRAAVHGFRTAMRGRGEPGYKT